MKKIAVIGTVEPTEQQRLYVKDFIACVDADATVISGCARGVDTIALKCAKMRGLKTICYVPWEMTFSFADEVIALPSVSEALRAEAYESVKKYHPAENIGKVSFVFLARNYLIVYQADYVLALPSIAKRNLGGTGQGCRIALGLGIPLKVIGENGQELQDVKPLL
jgi:predicted Rossmann fold nucleotide-binding protein DprA/Smf involved in DNA uptake